MSKSFSCFCGFQGLGGPKAESAHFHQNHKLKYSLKVGDHTIEFQRLDDRALLVCPEPACNGWEAQRWETFRSHMTSKHPPASKNGSLIVETTVLPQSGGKEMGDPSEREHFIQSTSTKRRRSRGYPPIPIDAASALKDHSEIQQSDSHYGLAGGTEGEPRLVSSPLPDVYSGDENDKPAKRPRDNRVIKPSTTKHCGSTSGRPITPELNDELGYMQESEPLDGAISYLRNDKILDSLGLRFHMHYKVLICLECAASFTPDELPGHLKTHKLKLTQAQLTIINSSLGVRTEPGVESLPAPGGPPVEGLTTHQGYRCKICPYACISPRTMEGHQKIHKATHGDIPLSSRSRAAHVQTFRLTTKRIFFEVQPSLANVPSATIWSAFLREEASKPTVELAAVPALRETEVPLLLKHTQWHTHLGDRIKEREGRKALLDMLNQPNTGPLEWLPDLSKAYMKEAVEIGSGADPFVLQMLESYPVLSLESKRWNIYIGPSSINGYGRSLTKFIRAALISMKAQKDAYQLPLCEESVALGLTVWDKLKTPLPKDKKKAEAAAQAMVPFLHPFLWKLLSARPVALRANRWDDPIQAYLPIRFLLPDGNFSPPTDVTPELAHWKYLIRCSAMLEAWNMKSHFQGDLIASTRQICEENFRAGAQSPFVSITMLQSKATSLAHSQTARPRITISPDVKWIAIDGHRLCLDTWRTGLQKLMGDAEGMLKRLCRGHEWSITIPENLVDDQTDEVRGNGWLNSGPFTKEHKPLMKVLLEDSESPVAQLGLDERPQWLPGKVATFMQDCGAFVEILAPLNHMVPAPSLRGVEFLDCKIRNSTLCRNYYNDHGDDVFIATRTKPDGPRDVTSYIPIFLPVRLQELVRRYLIIVRPVEEDFAERLWGKETRTLYNEYLYVSMGVPIEPKFSAILQRTILKYAKIDGIALQRYRQLSVAIKREFIRPEYDTENDFDDTSDEVSGHGTGIAISHYANQHGYHPTLTTDRLLRYRVFCNQWWNVTGFGSGPLPMPLRLRSINASRSALKGNTDGTTAMGLPLNIEVITNIVRDTVATQMLQLQSNLEGAIQKAVSEAFKPNQMLLAAAPSERDGLGGVGPRNSHEPEDSISLDPFENATAQLPSTLHLNDEVHLHIDVSQQADLDLDTGTSFPSKEDSHHGEGVLSDDILREHLRETLGVPDADFTCRQQLELIRHILLKESNVVGILPTGCGKSMAWLLPAKIPTEKVSIVIVPNEALLRDHLKTAQRLGVHAHHWTVNSQNYRTAKVIFVAVESMASQAFNVFFRTEEENIGRIIFDEGHLLVAAAKYRPKMDKYKDLAIFPVQRIVLSATIPPIMLPMLLRQCALPDSTLIIRAPSFRPLIRYHTVELTQLTHLPINDYVVLLAQMLERQIFKSDSRGIIYVQTKEAAVKVSSHFKDCAHYSTLSKLEKARNEGLWTEGEAKWIVATAGFAEGIDRPFVDGVIISGIPHSFLDLVQCPGRGGRAGRPSMAFLVNDFSVQHVVGDGSMDDPQLRKELMEWQGNDTDCVRLGISQVVDGVKITCSALTNAEVCSRCDPSTELYQATLALRVPTAPEGEQGEYDEWLSDWPSLTPEEWTALDSGVVPVTSSNSTSRLAQPFQLERTDAAPSRAWHITAASQAGLGFATQTAATPLNPNQARNLIPKQRTGEGLMGYAQHPNMKGSSRPPGTSARGFSSVREDASKAQQDKAIKIAKSVKLSRVMEFLRLCCPICWACIGHVDRSHALAESKTNGTHSPYIDCARVCGSGDTIPSYGWMDVKHKANFKRYTYCYGCHLPQTPFMPDCHRGHKFGKDCPFSDQLAHVIWVIRNLPKYWTAASHRFNLLLRMSEDQYGVWLGQEAGRGDTFHNGIEILLWFVEKYYPEVLGSSG